MKGFVLMANDEPVFCEVTPHAEPTQTEIARDDYVKKNHLTRDRGSLYTNEVTNTSVYLWIRDVDCPQEGP